jgi:acetyl esterase/lipase
MTSKHLVDPDLLPLIERMPGFRFSRDTLAATRTMMQAMRPAAAPPADVDVSERRIAGPNGAPDVGVVITRPKAAGSGRPGILHIHGGGYIMGTAAMNVLTDAAYAMQLGATVVSVDYRLAPETPHPGPVEDCYAALAWLHAQAAELGVDRERIAVTGESAGGGLAAATVLLARDRAQYAVAFQHLVSPMLDDHTTTQSDASPHLGEFVWTRDANLFGWTALLGGAPGGVDVSPYAAPARMADLSRLPPTFLACGALDLFLEENLDYARRLMRAGVATEVHIYPGAPHGFMMLESARVSKDFARDSMTAMGRGVGV